LRTSRGRTPVGYRVGRSETAERSQIVIGWSDGARGLSSERIEAPIRRLRRTSEDRRLDFALTDGARCGWVVPHCCLP